MAESSVWRSGVSVVRAETLDAAVSDPAGTGRTTAFNFAGTGGQATWVGAVRLKPGANTGLHHHGRHEVLVHVTRGRSEIRWGERLEFATEVTNGDVVYFSPHVPHQERNLSDQDAVDFLVVRSDDERIVVKLDGVPVEQPQRVY